MVREPLHLTIRLISMCPARVQSEGMLIKLNSVNLSNSLSAKTGNTGSGKWRLEWNSPFTMETRLYFEQFHFNQPFLRMHPTFIVREASKCNYIFTTMTQHDITGHLRIKDSIYVLKSVLISQVKLHIHCSRVTRVVNQLA